MLAESVFPARNLSRSVCSRDPARLEREPCPFFLTSLRRLRIFADVYTVAFMPKEKRSNPLALAVLVLLYERSMHPYEMAATLRQRHKEESIKLRYGSLYTVIEMLEQAGFIRAGKTSREG